MPDFLFILLLLIVAGTILAINLSKREQQKEQWDALPFLDDYLEQNPGCKTPTGIQCSKCGSKSIRNWGVFSAQSEERIFICNSCGTNLYRR